MSSLLSEPAGTEAEDEDKASLFWKNLSSAFLSLSILMCFLDAVSAFIRTSTLVDLMKSSVYSLKRRTSSSGFPSRHPETKTGLMCLGQTWCRSQF